MSLLLTAAAVVVVAVLAIVVVRRERQRLLNRIRANWGKPYARFHKIDSITAPCRSRLAVSGNISSVDDRTWADLDLDEVFVAIDRTDSTLGQQALFHRLHTAPPPDDLQAFEPLVTRMSTDALAPERAQIALARLQGAHGSRCAVFRRRRSRTISSRL